MKKCPQYGQCWGHDDNSNNYLQEEWHHCSSSGHSGASVERVVTKHTALWTCMIHLRHSWHEEWVRTWGSVILLIRARARDLVVVTQTQVSVFKNLSKERQQLKQELSICGSTLCLPGICGQQPGFCNKTRVSVCSSTSPEIFPPDVKAWWSGRASEPLCLFFFFKDNFTYLFI